MSVRNTAAEYCVKLIRSTVTLAMPSKPGPKSPSSSWRRRQGSFCTFQILPTKEGPGLFLVWAFISTVVAVSMFGNDLDPIGFDGVLQLRAAGKQTEKSEQPTQKQQTTVPISNLNGSRKGHRELIIASRPCMCAISVSRSSSAVTWHAWVKRLS